MNMKRIGIGLLLLTLSCAAQAGDIDPSGYQLLVGNSFFLLTDKSFTSDETALVRVETPDPSYNTLKIEGIDLVVYRVPQPLEFLKTQKNLHRPRTEGLYRGEGLANVLNYLWDSWYKKSRLAWQKIFSFDARKTVTENAPILKQTPPHTYHTKFSNHPQFRRMAGLEYVESFRYPVWQAQPAGAPQGVQMAGSSSNFIQTRPGNLYIPIGKRKPGLYLVEAIAGQYRANTLVFVSDSIAITKISSEQFFVWAVNQQTGKPSPNTAILLTDGVGTLNSGVTGADGAATFNKKNPERSYVIGEDAQGGVFVSENFYYDSEIYDAKIYTFTDRPLYRPGDTVFVKVMGRVFADSKASSPLAPAPVEMSVFDPQGTLVVTQSLAIDPAVAATDTSFALPELAASGGYEIRLKYQGKLYSAAFRVNQYVKPHYEIDIVMEQENFKTGEPVRGTVTLTYPSGKPVQGASVTLDLRAQQLAMVAGEMRYLGLFPLQLTETKYTASEKGVVAFELPAAEKPSRYILRVLSVDGATYRVTATKEILVEAGSAAFALAAKTRFSKPGEAVEFTLTPTATDAAAKTGDLRWEAVRLEDQSVTQGAIPPAAPTAAITFPQSGSYTVYLKNAAGVILGSASHWVEGADLKSVPGSLTILLDRDAYKIGDTAEALIIFSENVEEALLTMERDQVERYGLMTGQNDWVRVERLAENQWRARIPIVEAHSPNITFSVAYALHGQYVFQNKGLEVALPTIDVAFKPNLLEYAPGETVSVDVLTTLKGQPVEAAVTVSVVDEMIYVLQPEIAPSIGDFFYHRRRNQVRTSSSLNFYTYDVAVPANGANSGNSYSERPLKLRERPRRDDVDTALWLPTLKTDANGRARFSFVMPDSLTRWRITGRAISADGAVGQKTAYVKSSKDFYLKWTGPTVFRQSDRPTLHLVAFNLLVKPTPTSATFFVNDHGKTQERAVTLQPGANYLDLALPKAQPGDIVTGLRINGKTADEFAAAIRVAPDRWLSAKTQSFAVSGNAMTIPLPDDAANLRLRLSNGLADGFFAVADRLIDYPYGCVEQTSSRLIPLAFALKYFKEASATPELIARLTRLLQTNRLRLIRMAGPNAVFGWWGNLTRDSLFMTAYAYYADWNASRALGVALPASHWEHLLEVYKNASESETLFTKTVALWLASEIGLPTQTLFEGAIDEATQASAPGNAGGKGSAVLTEGETAPQYRLAAYLLRLAAQKYDLKTSDALDAAAKDAAHALADNPFPLARAILLFGKRQQGGDSASLRGETIALLNELAGDEPTIDRALSLMFLNMAAALDLTDSQAYRVRLDENWREQATNTGRPIWQYSTAAPAPKSVTLAFDAAPPQGASAQLTYDSYAPDETSLTGLHLYRTLYRVESKDGATFEAIPVKTGEPLDASKLYVDEIEMSAAADAAGLKYGVLEVPLTPGASVESTTWGVRFANWPDESGAPAQLSEARHVSGELQYAIPVEETGNFTFRHLVRFSQTGTFTLPRVRYYQMYNPANRAYESGWEDAETAQVTVK